MLLFGITEEPQLKPYVAGKLSLAGIDSRAPVSTYLSAVYAIVAEAPHEVLERLMGYMVTQSAIIAPDRENWGVLPEHQAMSRGLTTDARQGAPDAQRQAGQPPG